MARFILILSNVLILGQALLAMHYHARRTLIGFALVTAVLMAAYNVWSFRREKGER